MQTYEPLVTTARSPQHNRDQRHAAFAQLVMQFHTMACTYAQQLLGDEQLAQDAAQEAFLAAYQQLAKLREPAAFPGWLRRIVHTQCHRLLRNKRPTAIPFSDMAQALATDGDLAQLVADADTAQAIVDCVMAAVADLPEHERSVVRLFYFDGYSIREVAETLGLPVTTIKKRLQYARNRLRNRLTTSFNHGGVTIQSWVLQAGQWLLPLFVLSPAPLLCPLFATEPTRIITASVQTLRCKRRLPR